MKKLVKILALVLIISTVCTFLVACEPEEQEPTAEERKDYGVTALEDLKDYSTDSVPDISYSETDKTDATTKLTAKIDALNTEYYDDTLNAMQKILKNSDASTFVCALEYSEMPANQMKDLVAYIASGTTVDAAKTDFENATGLIEDYSAINEWTDEMDGLASTSDAYKDIYRKRAKKSYAMNTKLASVGAANGQAMDGGQAARALIEVIQYAESVVAGEKMMGAISPKPNMTDYFKTVLYAKVYDTSSTKDGSGKYEKETTFDWDTSAYSILVTVRSFNHLRWGGAGQTTDAVVKTGTYDKASIAANDKALVKAWGYSYDYEMASYKALTKDEYYKNIEYTLKSQLSDAESVEAAAIQQKLYTKAYRYKDTFYKEKYVPAMEPISRTEELYEACVYGFIADTSASWASPTNFTAAAAVSVEGVTGKTEATITYQIGSLSGDNRYTAAFKRGVDIGMSEFLLSTDMEYYWSKTEANVKAQAAAQRKMDDNSDRGANADYNTSYYEGLWELDMENLKSSQFIVDEFLKEDTGSAELGRILKYQIYNYQSDYIRSINQLKAHITMDIQSLINDNAYVKDSTGYKKIADYTLTTEQSDIVYNIGYNCAVLDSMKADFGTFNVTNQLSAVDNVKWKGDDTMKGINDNINDAVSKNYTSYSGKSKVTALQDTLVKKIWVHKSNSTAPTYENRDDIPSADSANYVQDYDTNHQLSRLLNNHDKVMYYTAGQVQITLKKGVSFSSKGIDYENHVTDEHEKMIGGYEDAISTFTGSVLFTNTSGIAQVDREGRKYTKDDKWYLKYEYVNDTLNYYYQVTADDTFRYDVTLYMGYTG